MLRRRKQIEEQISISEDRRKRRREENEKRIIAIERAWIACTDDCEREFIKLNLFEHIQMQYIDLPISERTMKRYRKRFLVRLAQNLYEI